MKKKNTDEMDDDLLPHYDFKNMTIVKRGIGYADKPKIVRVRSVNLEPDVAQAFASATAVNNALRSLIPAKRSPRRSSVTTAYASQGFRKKTTPTTKRIRGGSRGFCGLVKVKAS